MEAATPAPVPAGTRTEDPPVAEGPRAADAAVTDLSPAAAKADLSPAVVTPEPVAALAAAPVSVKLVDYGPVAPTPVVDLLALQQQATRAGFRKSTRSTSRPAQKSAAGTQPEARPAAVAQPVKKRLCWTKGVVAPCR